MLIIGGLVVIGVIALIAAILLALAEGRSAKAVATQMPTQTIPAASQASASVSPTEAPRAEDTRSTPEAHDVSPERAEPVQEARSSVYSSGQFHEVVTQLQKLHEQSKDLQARLGQLSETVDHMKQREADMLELPRARRVS
jgi:cytoskeletal protein RodZ